MPDLSDLLPGRRGPSTALRGRIATDIQDPATDELFVTIEAYDGHRQRWGPCQWVPASSLPSRGDDCLVIFDEDEVPWVLTLEYVLADVDADATAATLAAGSAATVAVDEDPINQFHFAFGIPKGDKGDPGVSPVGSVVMFAGAAAPAGWLVCDGSPVSRTTYAGLFAAIGTTWGAGDGSSTFNLPDLRKRVPVGPGSGLALGATDGVAEATRHPKHHHHVGANTASVADHTHPGVADHQHPAVGDHQHASAGAHSHSTGQGNEFATTVENTGTRGTSSTTFTLVSGGINATDTQGAHQHPAAGGHQHAAAGGHTHGAAGAHFHNIDADTTGGGPTDGPAYAVLNYLIRAL